VHDHASALTGEYNGLGALLNKECEGFIMDLKDPCHSINLALLQSLESLPDQVTNFVTEIHNHFISPQRVAYLHKIQLEKGYSLLSPKHYIKTRWLSIGESLNRLLLIWHSLIDYMRKRPPFPGMKKEKYDEFTKLLENKEFKLQIIFMNKVIGKLNETSIKFQNQTSEIQNLKLEISRCLRDLAKLYVHHHQIPKNVIEFSEKYWTNSIEQQDKFLSPRDFIISISENLDSRLREIEKLSEDQQNNFADTFQIFLAKLLSLLIHYLPITDKLIDSLDFVSLNSEYEQLKEQIFTFNEYFQVVPENKIAELINEITSLMEENLILLKKTTKKSSLSLWNLFLEINGEGPDGEMVYPHLSKIFRIAHVLPVSSAGVEQSFSTLKLIRSSLRNRLKEETVQSLLLIHQQDLKNFVISEETVRLFDEFKIALLKRKTAKNITIDLKDQEQNNALQNIIQNENGIDEENIYPGKRKSLEANHEEFKHEPTFQEKEKQDLSKTGSDEENGDSFEPSQGSGNDTESNSLSQFEADEGFESDDSELYN